MNCGRARQLASLEVDEQLSAGDLVSLREHLAACSACSAFHRDVKVIRDGARALSSMPAPDDFLLGVNRKLVEARLVANPRRRAIFGPAIVARSWKLAVVAAAAAMLAMLATHTYRTAPADTAAASFMIETAASQDLTLTTASPLDDISVARLAGAVEMDNERTYPD